MAREPESDLGRPGRPTAGHVVQDLVRHGFPAELHPVGLVVHGCPGRTWEPPVRVLVTDEDVERFARDVAADGLRRWPDDEPVQAGYRLLLVRLGEALVREALAGSVIELRDLRMETRPTRRPEPTGPLVWLSPEQFRARFGRGPAVPVVEPNPFDPLPDR